MELYEIEGGIPLKGEVRIQGSKNAVLPMMAASVLQKGCVCFQSCPEIADVTCMEKILQSIGAKVWREDGDLYVDCEKIDTEVIPGAYADKMRSSIILMGPLIARMGSIAVSHPGGCTIGARPIDLHLAVLQALGVEIKEQESTILGSCCRLKGGKFTFSKVSVGATENAILAAVTAEGVTVLENCAREPEIVHLCRFLQSMGAEIRGIGESRIEISGVRELHPSTFLVPADRIVAGTYLLAGAITRGVVSLLGAPAEEMKALLDVYAKMGGQYEVIGGKLVADSRRLRCPVKDLKTACYPGFPTDLQSPLLAVCATVNGVSQMEETIFEDRYKAATEMKSMGADIEITGRKAKICGRKLHGAFVCAEDLRGGAALVLAGLGAKGYTRIEGICHIERGYQNICKDLSELGARIVRVTMMKTQNS